MSKEKALEGPKDTFTLRIPNSINEEIKNLSNELGISQNSLILLFINVGIKSYENVIIRNQEEFRRFLSQNQK